MTARPAPDPPIRFTTQRERWLAWRLLSPTSSEWHLTYCDLAFPEDRDLLSILTRSPRAVLTRGPFHSLKRAVLEVAFANGRLAEEQYRTQLDRLSATRASRGSVPPRRNALRSVDSVDGPPERSDAPHGGYAF